MTAIVRADSGDFEAIPSTAAWSYGDYKVEKLDFDKDAIGPLSMGSHVIVAEPVETCKPNGCDRYHISVLENGMKMSIGNVPSVTLNEERYFVLGERFMYMDYSDIEQHYWNVVEVSLENGEETLKLKDFFLDGVVAIDVDEDNGKFYFDPSFNWNNHKGYSNGAIYEYNPATDMDRVITDHWVQNRDEMQDVQNGVVLSKMVFPSGEKQLWLYDPTKDPVSMRSIPDTWTPKHEDIVGAHFRTDGSVEYFRMFERFIYKNGVTTAQGDYLSWFKTADDALQIVNGRMAWVDPEDTLFVSDATGVVALGALGTPDEFRLTADAIYYGNNGEGKQYTFATKLIEKFPFVVTDAIDGVLVGVDAAGSVWYLDEDSGDVLELGAGIDPVLADAGHVYWRGANGGIYEATIMLSFISDMNARAVKSASDPTVYLVINQTAYKMLNESVYFSWFDSWADLKVISDAEFKKFAFDGNATYAPGSKLKLAGDAKVYLVGADGKLHWISSQKVAYDIYGSTWNKGIITITQMDLANMGYGSPIMTEAEAQNI